MDVKCSSRGMKKFVVRVILHSIFTHEWNRTQLTPLMQNALPIQANKLCNNEIAFHARFRYEPANTLLELFKIKYSRGRYSFHTKNNKAESNLD